MKTPEYKIPEYDIPYYEDNTRKIRDKCNLL
nr:MAG TPA: hypothetical protein [Bacteriophage sp.]